jgi:probable addiction module antidote protein
MNTVFIGGSRHISRLPVQVKERLDNVMKNGHQVIIGDANGADKAVQKHLLEAAYDKVTVFCSGDLPRNNLGQWPTHHVMPPKSAKGFHFYAAKDREMAHKADFGLMIWDGRSPGTVLNVLRLVQAGKSAVLINVPDRATHTIKSAGHWNDFLSCCSPELLADLRERATPEEWKTTIHPQASLFDEKTPDVPEPATESSAPMPEEESTAAINAALASGDPVMVVDALGGIARARGMTQIAKETGLARESLYRSLGASGNPEFATVLKIIAALGLRLEARPNQPLPLDTGMEVSRR